VAQVLAAFRDLAAYAKRSAGEAHEVLAGVLEPIVLRRAPEGGYEAEIALKNTKAAIAGGRVLESKYRVAGARKPGNSRVAAQCSQAFW
jgi:hypothetical protein